MPCPLPPVGFFAGLRAVDAALVVSIGDAYGFAAVAAGKCAQDFGKGFCVGMRFAMGMIVLALAFFGTEAGLVAMVRKKRLAALVAETKCWA